MVSFPGSRLLALLAVVLAAPPTGADVAPASTTTIAFSSSALEFSNTALTETQPLAVTLTNGTALSVDLTQVRFSGANAADFSQTNTCPRRLPAGQSCVFYVTFKPSAFMAQAATLTVKTDDPAVPSVVLLLRGHRFWGAINDTGITRCGDASQNSLPCPVSGFPRQDAEFGRDKTRNHNADGHAGFSFTKLNAQGKSLPASAASWRCVRDNVTGLVWEAKPKSDGKIGNQGLHDADDTYTWYSTDSTNNGGFAGNADNGNFCQGYSSANAATYCNTEAYVKRVNATGWCGSRDWRVPNRKELRGLVDLSVPYPGPVIDIAFFPDTQPSWYWSSSPRVDNGYAANGVYFNYGYGYWAGKGFNGSVRLVRGGQR